MHTVQHEAAVERAVEETVQAYRSSDAYVTQDQFVERVTTRYRELVEEESVSGVRTPTREYPERVRETAERVWSDVVTGSSRWDEYPMNTRID